MYAAPMSRPIFSIIKTFEIRLLTTSKKAAAKQQALQLEASYGTLDMPASAKDRLELETPTEG